MHVCLTSVSGGLWCVSVYCADDNLDLYSCSLRRRAEVDDEALTLMLNPGWQVLELRVRIVIGLIESCSLSL